MAATGVGFRWLDILEKEFDKACVELDTSLVELESEEPEVVFGARQRIATLSSCFAQLTHKALTVFQHSAKLEAEIVDMRADLIQARAASAAAGDAPSSVTELTRARAEAAQLTKENAALRETVLALHSELFGARLATKYLDKELAGRIQQLQLLGKDMRTDVRDSLWAQVEAEILLQRHKTLVRVCRGLSPAAAPCRPPAAPRDCRAPRTVRVRREPSQGLGISVTGGREHGVPILISELEADGPAARTGDLYVGDAILAVNDIDLTQACHKEAVHALQSTKGDCELCVQFVATDDDDRLSEDNYRFPLYPDGPEGAFEGPLDGKGATPTAPRTPDYHRPPSEASYSEEECAAQAIDSHAHAVASAAAAAAVGTRNHAAILDMDDHSIKIQAELETGEDVESSPCSMGGRHRGPYRAVASSDSAGSTPVHRGVGAGVARRRAHQWRERGAYRSVQAAASPEPDPHIDVLQDCSPLTPPPEKTPLLVLPLPNDPPRLPNAAPNSSHSKPNVPNSAPNVSYSTPSVPNSTTYVLNSAPNVPNTASNVFHSTPSVPNSTPYSSHSAPYVSNPMHDIENSVPNVPNSTPNVPSSVPNVSKSANLPNSKPNVPNAVLNGDSSANGDSKKRDKAFRIGSARRVTPQGGDRTVAVGPGDRSVGSGDRTVVSRDHTVGSGDRTVGSRDRTVGSGDRTVGSGDRTAGPLSNGVALRGKHAPPPPLLAGEGDPDFGTPV